MPWSVEIFYILSLPKQVFDKISYFSFFMWSWCQSFETDTNEWHKCINQWRHDAHWRTFLTNGWTFYLYDEKWPKCCENYSHTKISNFIVLTLWLETLIWLSNQKYYCSKSWKKYFHMLDRLCLLFDIFF